MHAADYSDSDIDAVSAVWRDADHLMMVIEAVDHWTSLTDEWAVRGDL